LLLTFYGWQNLQFLANISDHAGLGYHRAVWRNSETLAIIRQSEPDKPIFTNSPEAVYLHTGISAQSLPKKFETATQQLNENYDFDMQYIHTEMPNGAYLVLFDAIPQVAFSGREELMQELSPHPVVQMDDGVIYGPTFPFFSDMPR
jgi:hypothetical protein